MDENYARFSRLLIDRPHARVLRVIMNRPDKLNAVDGAMHRELSEIWRVIDADPNRERRVAHRGRQGFLDRRRSRLAG